MSTPSENLIKTYNKSFCIKPFTEISNSAIGERMLCCQSEPVGMKIKNPDIAEDFFNNPAMHEIRRKMLAGEEVKQCWQCKESEMASGKSHRTFIMQDFEKEEVDEIFETGKVELKSIDIRFGTKCNLACVMCGPGSSSLIAKEEDDEIGLIDLNDFSLDQIKKYSEGIVLFKTTGGEPMLMSAYKKTLEFFVEKDFAKNIEFTTITNGTIDYSDLMPLMNEFKLFKISHSIDAADESYNYVRWPGKMSRIKRIHKRIVENAKQYKNIKLEWGATIHVLNVNQVVKISKYLQTLGMHNAYNIDMVQIPNYMQPGLVPKQVLDELEVEALQWQDWQPGLYRQEILDFIETLKYNYTKINKDPNNKKVLLDELEVKTIFWKAKRNLDVRDYVPYYKALKTK
jgi:MoaA/NifB/PqqE/SkfB family radical SAM enzyme|tara:strand:+ start:385 stop:1581 length:1197 start_codon:yes stop_codon:yes gene_type:complete